MKCKLFFSLLFISISISAQNNIEINLSKKQLKEIKKIEKFKLMGLNNYGIDINANDWVSALRYYLIGKTVSNNNGIPILVPISTFGNKYLIQGKNVSGSPIRNYENTNVDFREPLWVIDGVPIRIPLVTKGDWGSFGTAFLLTVILADPNAASTSFPVKPLSTISTRNK